ncbi:MAG: CinA family nicotinamide mononucleotide deamidase-related protein [Ardenticatenaceae bacterium]|nr:CinA family nicotinamide mononucleotide deamidase-related protein [Ardenticatenaceae bacterium]
MNVEIVTIGTELLLGQIVDTNAAWLAQQLAELGLNLYRKTTVGDNSERIVAALREALERSQVVITSGGLGPTVDDKTREAVARATGRELVLDETLLAGIETLFRQRGYTLTAGQRRQAFVPAGAVPMPNPVGTAPCFAVELDGRWIIALPGVPRELKHMFTTVVDPFLRERFDLRQQIRSRTLRAVGIGEGALGDLLQDLMEADNPTVGTAAHPGMVDVRIVASGEDSDELDRLLDATEAEVRARLGDRIYGVDGETLAEVVVRGLEQRGLTLALAETNTAGRLAQQFLDVPASTAGAGGADVLPGALVLGSDELVRATSGVPAETALASPEVATGLARAVRSQFGTAAGLALVSSTRANVNRYDPTPGETFVTLVTGEATHVQHERVGGSNDLSVGLLLAATLDVVRRTLLLGASDSGR